MTTALRTEIKKLARKSVHDAVEAELMRIRASLMPLVSTREQREIERMYKKPSRKIARTVRARF